MKPLILISNDDGYAAKGLRTLITVVREMADVVVMSTEFNSSAKSLSLTTTVPLRVRTISQEPGLEIYACTGTPVDSVKLGTEHFCSRRPDLVLSGINHGSNASINVLYSGTMGVAIEAVTNGYPAIGFSLVDHHYDADFSPCIPYVHNIITDVLQNKLPEGVALNVNFPSASAGPIQGVKVCRTARACWTNSFERRIDPYGHPYWWLTGDFVCNDNAPDTDQWALDHGYVSIVPQKPDYTDFDAIGEIQRLASIE